VRRGAAGRESETPVSSQSAAPWGKSMHLTTIGFTSSGAFLTSPIAVRGNWKSSTRRPPRPFRLLSSQAFYAIAPDAPSREFTCSWNDASNWTVVAMVELQQTFPNNEASTPTTPRLPTVTDAKQRRRHRVRDDHQPRRMDSGQAQRISDPTGAHNLR